MVDARNRDMTRRLGKRPRVAGADGNRPISAGLGDCVVGSGQRLSSARRDVHGHGNRRRVRLGRREVFTAGGRQTSSRPTNIVKLGAYEVLHATGADRGRPGSNASNDVCLWECHLCSDNAASEVDRPASTRRFLSALLQPHRGAGRTQRAGARHLSVAGAVSGGDSRFDAAASAV